MLSKLQLEVINGSMLGDAMLEKFSPGNSRFVENHSIRQKGWLEFKKEIFTPIRSTLFDIKTVGRKRLEKGRIISDTSKSYEGCKLRTARNKIFNALEYKWYKRNNAGKYVFKKIGNQQWRIKVVPEDIILTPLTLATWYLDDGCNHRERKECALAAMAFTPREINSLKEKLSNLDICCHVSKDYKIIIISKSYYDFINIVTKAIPAIPDCMKYKLTS